MAKNKKNYLIIFILLILTLPAIWSLFYPGFFLSDDGEWMIIRFSAFHQALVDGQFPVRWLGRLNQEYGYPVANFLYPGFMYLAEVPKIIGFGFVDSIKIILGLSMVGSAVFTYLWLSKFFGKWESFIGSIFYLYAPYHLYDLYERGSVGEILALALAPFILWQIERKSLFWSTAGIALLIVSHNTLALLFIPLIIIYALISKYLNILISFFFALLLSAFFWIPAIFDLGYTRFSQTQVSNWQDYFADFNLAGWSTIIIFTSTLFIVSLSILGKVISRSNYLENRSKIFYLFLSVGLGSVFLTLPQSSFIWQALPVGFIQFPFRFLSLTILSTAYLAPHLLNEISGQKRWVMATILVVTLLSSAAPYARPLQFFDKGDGFYATNMDTTTVRGEYMPRWVKVFPTERPLDKVEIIKGKGEIKNQVFNSKKIAFSADLEGDILVQVNTVYFPGWQAWVDGQKSPINYENERGLIQIPLPKGQHQVLVKFGETPLRLFSDIISLSSLIIITVLTTKKYRLIR